MGLNSSKCQSIERLKQIYQEILNIISQLELHEEVKKHLIREQIQELQSFSLPDTLITEIYPASSPFLLISGLFGPFDDSNTYVYIKIHVSSDKPPNIFKILDLSTIEAQKNYPKPNIQLTNYPITSELPSI